MSRPIQPPPPSHRRTTNLGRFWYGVAYYPELWDAETRKHDAERMAAAGITLVRMGEFAWSLLEPAENHFYFALLDETVATLARHGIATLLATPTAAPPRWLTQKHPEVLRVDAAGQPQCHGSRQHACPSNPAFREYSRRITQALARHFHGNPHVVGWQTDNAFNADFAECHCPACQTAFRDFLRRTYKNQVRRLNQAWGTAFWAQTYAGFEEIETPRPNRPTHPNPAHQLDYVRFISDAITQFQHDQTQILRRANPAWWLTHNGTGRHLDYRGDFTRDLDLLGFANQPMAEPDPARRHQRQAWRLDQARGWSGNFIVTGQQAGPGGQPHCLHDNPEPGEMRQMAYAAIARGADSLLLARWRTCRVGAEKLHGGLLDHDNLPRRRYAEAAQLGRELATLGPALQDTTVFIDAAVASCDLAVATAHAHYSLGLPSPDEAAATLHAALHELGYAVGVVHPADDLTGIKLYVIPHWNLFDPAWLPNLRHFVETGGTLVLGARCGSHGLHANVVAETFPGCLRELAGATVEEYGRQNAPQARPLTLAFNCCEGAVASEWWHETLRPATPETEIHATWKGQHLTGQTAATRHRLGKGCVIYVGTWFTPELVRAMLPHLVLQASLQKPWPAAPAGVEVVRRQKDGHRLWFFLNHNDAAVAIPSTPVGTDLLTGRHTDGGELPLGRHGAAVVHEELATPA